MSCGPHKSRSKDHLPLETNNMPQYTSVRQQYPTLIGTIYNILSLASLIKWLENASKNTAKVSPKNGSNLNACEYNSVSFMFVHEIYSYYADRYSYYYLYFFYAAIFDVSGTFEVTIKVSSSSSNTWYTTIFFCSLAELPIIPAMTSFSDPKALVTHLGHFLVCNSKQELWKLHVNVCCLPSKEILPFFVGKLRWSTA